MSEELTERNAERKPVVMGAQCRTNTGLRDKGEISDISETGCCIRTRSLFFRVGTLVSIKPEGIEGLVGTVRWIAGDRAGIEFQSPIYGPVLEHLVARCGAGQQVDVVGSRSGY